MGICLHKIIFVLFTMHEIVLTLSLIMEQKYFRISSMKCLYALPNLTNEHENIILKIGFILERQE